MRQVLWKEQGHFQATRVPIHEMSAWQIKVLVASGVIYYLATSQGPALVHVFLGPPHSLGETLTHLYLVGNGGLVCAGRSLKPPGCSVKQFSHTTPTYCTYKNKPDTC